jgi:hypothetical protein
VDPRAGLDEVENGELLTVLRPEIRPLCRPTLSHALYRLRHPGSSKTLKRVLKKVYEGVERFNWLRIRSNDMTTAIGLRVQSNNLATSGF